MNTFSQILVYDVLKDKTFRKFNPTKLTKPQLQLITSAIKKPASVLDVGCGFGRIAIPLAKKGYEVTGVDLSKNCLKEARRRGRGLPVTFRHADMLDLPLKKESFDGIICIWSTFNHLLTWKAQLRALKEMERVLKPGGRALLDLAYRPFARKMGLKLFGRDGRRCTVLEAGSYRSDFYLHDTLSVRRLCSHANITEFTTEILELPSSTRLILTFEKK